MSELPYGEIAHTEHGESMTSIPKMSVLTLGASLWFLDYSLAGNGLPIMTTFRLDDGQIRTDRLRDLWIAKALLRAATARLDEAIDAVGKSTDA